MQSIKKQSNFGSSLQPTRTPFLGSKKIDNVKKSMSQNDDFDGFMRYIQSIQKSGNQLTVKAVDGEFYHGIVRSFDNKTISLKIEKEDGFYTNKVFFFNNIVYFELKAD